MCKDCGCSLTDEVTGQVKGAHTTFAPLNRYSHGHSHGHSGGEHREQITVLTRLLAQNDESARHNRNHLNEHGVLAINFMSAPGSGKTSLLEMTVQRLRERFRIHVIEGDLATENDARRIRAHGVPATQLNTGSACHLDASMLHSALHQIQLADIDLLLIENVGNLVCPASFDLGQHRNVVLLSVPEGDDKPEKYPVMFRVADLVLLTKADLLPYLTEFSVPRAERSLQSIACDAPVVELSARSGVGMDAWCAWLEAEYLAIAERRSSRGEHLITRQADAG